MSDRLAVITGATSGIGAAYAEAFAKQGYHLLLAGRREAELCQLADRLREQYGIKVQLEIGDLADHHDLHALVDTVTLLPSLDALVNNAGYAVDGRLGDVDWSDHQALVGCARTCHDTTDACCAAESGQSKRDPD
jgi:uncharacterized protein